MSKSGIPFVMRVPGSDNYHYRRDVPADVRKTIGVTRWSKSLGSGSKRDVAEHARALAAEHDRLIALHRRKDPLEALNPDDRKRVEQAGGVEAFMARQRGRWQGANLAANVADMVRDYPPEVDDPAVVESEAAALEASARVLNAAIVKDGAILDQLGIALPPRLRRPVDSSPEGVTLRQIFEKWKGTGRASEAQFRIPMEAFEKKFGPVPVRKITVDQCREFRDYLATGDRADVTSRKYFVSFKTLLNYAVNEGHIDASPADKLTWRAEKVKHSERIEGKRRTFSPAETDKLLKALPIYAAESYEHTQVAWFVRIACWTGMRPEEIAQLAPGDVCEVAGVWVFRVHDLHDNNVKTRAGVREVPVHRWLIDAGLLAFVEKRPKEKRLFALCQKADGRGRRYPPIYSRWTHFLRERLKLTDSKLSMYSFRHGMKDALRLASVGEYEQDRLLGHARKGREVQDGYGRAQIVVLNDALQKADPLDPRRTVTQFNGGVDS
ncbi:phage integrase SAM-like domain-containing protein [Methylocystis sp. S23]